MKTLDSGLKAGYNAVSHEVPSDLGDQILMRTKQRFMLAVAIGTLLVVPLSIPLADTSGRDYSRCISSCNAIRQACTGRCAADCQALFPNDSIARSACVAQCKDNCVAEDKECKDRCQAIKNGVCPSEP